MACKPDAAIWLARQMVSWLAVGKDGWMKGCLVGWLVGCLNGQIDGQALDANGPATIMDF